MKTASAYQAALYMRLSKEDDGVAESDSIATQRRILRAYAKENGFCVYNEYIDDGWSGTSFERPAFKRMIADIEGGRVNLVLTKDLSRLGRDYITAGRYTELYFPGKGVRYIAVNDGYDSDGPYTDIAPFKNVVNEMYARDASKKIRSALKAKMQGGAYIASFAPYGYQKDPANKNHLVTDAQSGAVVKEVFYMAARGSPPGEIARTLHARGVPSPAVYRCMTHEGLDVDQCSKRQIWTSATITKMLKNIVYLGHTAQGKTAKISFKSPASHSTPRAAWIVVENTHEALVEAQTFDLVRRRRMARTCERKGAFFNLFSGIAKCADCGRNMSATGTRKKGSPANLVCGGYKLYGSDECSNHFIDYNILYEIVLSSLKEQLCISEAARAAILDNAERLQQKQTREKSPPDALASVKKRLRTLESIIRRLYEDHAAGRLSDARMNKLLSDYAREAASLEGRVASIENNAAHATPTQASREDLDTLLRQITDPAALSPTLLFTFIDHIEIGQGHYEKGEHGKIKRQAVRIYYRFQTEAAVKEYAL